VLSSCPALAQHGKEASPKSTAAPASHKEPASPSRPPSGEKLHGALSRIAQEITGTPGGSTTSKAVSQPASTASPARMRVVWRVTLVWPPEIRPTSDESTDKRVALTWR